MNQAINSAPVSAEQDYPYFGWIPGEKTARIIQSEADIPRSKDLVILYADSAADAAEEVERLLFFNLGISPPKNDVPRTAYTTV